MAKVNGQVRVGVHVVLFGFMGMERQELERWINGHEDWKVVAKVETMPELLAVPQPSLYVMGLDLCAGRPIEMLRDLRWSKKDARVLVVAPHHDRLLAERCLKAGALGYCNNRVSVEELEVTMAKVLRGETAVASSVMRRLLRKAVGICDDEDVRDTLTDRQLEAVFLCVRDKTAKVAARMGLAAKTVDTHLMNARVRLGFASTCQLRAAAIRWIEMDLQGTF